MPNGTTGDNVTMDRLKTCYTQEEALPRPAEPLLTESPGYPYVTDDPPDVPLPCPPPVPVQEPVFPVPTSPFLPLIPSLPSIYLYPRRLHPLIII